MTASEQNKSPDFFENNPVDPVASATRQKATGAPVAKKKAGFYLTQSLLERFDRTFHQMKLEGLPVDNKSALLEAMIVFSLDDLKQGARSRLLGMIESRLDPTMQGDLS